MACVREHQLKSIETSMSIRHQKETCTDEMYHTAARESTSGIISPNPSDQILIHSFAKRWPDLAYLMVRHPLAFPIYCEGLSWRRRPGHQAQDFFHPVSGAIRDIMVKFLKVREPDNAVCAPGA